ncbi:hypothetical protein SAMN02745215_04276 [Desulfitobacterium chlororespirans DSM 11544]|uniref:Uncharacterized protein n=1 Tax=Desulfitobacterium chlororespirans DSM 11544 TaxID=1121395 RepID=A0A1M7UP21_9FIRM|nr:hypothetical protein SAMN02745215_04276 [Desulfitobacterium chlororespirans DSM 11544]
MDWITGIQRAVDYVEAHLTEPIMKKRRSRLIRPVFIFQKTLAEIKQ